MPPTHTDEGLVAAATIRARQPTTSVLVLSSYVEIEYAQRLLAQGGDGVGCLLKDRIADIVVLVDALHRVAAGETVVDPTIVSRLIADRRRHAPLHELTAREHEILDPVAQGYSNHGIADKLVITDRTVETHVRQVLAKLDITDAPGVFSSWAWDTCGPIIVDSSSGLPSWMRAIRSRQRSMKAS
jgi:DNA-binding NarL/FixJ family response regulator